MSRFDLGATTNDLRTLARRHSVAKRVLISREELG